MAKKKRSPNKAGAHSKAKGAAFERATAQKLSLWISNAKSKDYLWRSAMSGGRFTRSRRSKDGMHAENSVGDMSARHPHGFMFLSLFSVECKFYIDLQLSRVLFGGIGLFKLLWYAPFEEARVAGREPLVIMKQNRQEPLVLTTKKGLEILQLGTTREGGRLRARAVFNTHKEHSKKTEPAILLSLRDVFLRVDFQRMMRHAQN